jgi:hypothetical protein
MVSPEVAAIALTFAVHVLGAAILIVGMFDEDTDRFGWWPRTRRGDDGPPPPPPPPRLGPDGLPLPDAEQSPRRLRDPHRGPLRRRRRRVRPAREPLPERTPAPATTAPADRDAPAGPLG